mmetsp:Transcript_10380/g.32455  ORF Transcript_10380/g.32455 Transcript_10380/m.32455 type:complete len:252 (-) Transcript_10380:237-992(-)
MIAAAMLPADRFGLGLPTRSAAAPRPYASGTAATLWSATSAGSPRGSSLVALSPLSGIMQGSSSSSSSSPLAALPRPLPSAPAPLVSVADGDAALREAARVHRSLEVRLAKLDAGLVLRDGQLEALARQYEEAHRYGAHWRDRAERLEEEMVVLRRLLLERDDEAVRLRRQLATSCEATTASPTPRLERSASSLSSSLAPTTPHRPRAVAAATGSSPRSSAGGGASVGSGDGAAGGRSVWPPSTLDRPARS